MDPGNPEPLLAGRLGPISLQDLMGFLAAIRVTGTLTVKAPEGEMAVHWNDGDVVWAEPRSGGVDAVGWLAESRSLTEGEIEDARRRSGRRDPAAALVDTGEMTVGDLRRFRLELVSENVYAMLGWSPGTFELSDDSGLPGEAEPLRLEVQGLLLEAAHRYDEWNRLPGAYADPETRFEHLSEPKNDTSVVLSLDEWRILYLVSSCRNLGEIWAESHLESEIETSRTLYGLASARLVRPVREGDDLDVGTTASPDPDALRFTGAMVPPSGQVEAFGGDQTMRLTSSPLAGGETSGDKEADRPITGPPTSVRRLSRSEIRVRQVSRLVELGDGGLVVPLGKDPVTLGRAPDNDVILDDKHVSGRHARIARDGDHHVLEDLGSSNGVLVDGKRVLRIFLRGGAEIEIHPFRFRFERRVEIIDDDEAS